MKHTSTTEHTLVLTQIEFAALQLLAKSHGEFVRIQLTEKDEYIDVSGVARESRRFYPGVRFTSKEIKDAMNKLRIELEPVEGGY